MYYGGSSNAVIEGWIVGEASKASTEYVDAVHKLHLHVEEFKVIREEFRCIACYINC
ncbi:MAG: hypothetical protein N3D82_00680 [Ignisphaera sp.]|nr:hypothetical protein [Ignisphaera sp.]MCX8167529.1 hypothetical protein [Ignisphaera sp.]MDW8086019.1 hypothetical protein [Ignisphaera sp.]